MAILHTARLCGAEYEWTQHAAIALAVGVTEAQVAALDKGQLDAPCFDPCQRAVLTAATDLVRGDPMPEAHFTELQKHLSTREIVELVLATGFYVTLARLMVLADINPIRPWVRTSCGRCGDGGPEARKSPATTVSFAATATSG
jgi:alkylhydroperoxidase family enzyme